MSAYDNGSMDRGRGGRPGVSLEEANQDRLPDLPTKMAPCMDNVPFLASQGWILDRDGQLLLIYLP